MLKGTENGNYEPRPEDDFVESYGRTIVGGYENPDQSLPSGKGLFRFESFDANVEGFESESFEDVLKYIYRNLKPFRIVRTKDDTWTVESNEEIYGELRAYGAYLDCDRNGSATVSSKNTAFDRDGDKP